MLIKQGYFVKDLYLHNRKSPITYTYGGAHSTKVLLKQASKKNLPHKKSDGISICRAWGNFKPSEKIKKIFISISNNELPEKMRDNADISEYLENTAKTVERIHLDYFPQPFKDFLRNVRTELHDIIKRTVDIYMWRCGVPAGHDPLFNGGMSFSLDGKKWNMVPPSVQVHFSAFSIPPPPKNVSLILKKLINQIEQGKIKKVCKGVSQLSLNQMEIKTYHYDVGVFYDKPYKEKTALRKNVPVFSIEKVQKVLSIKPKNEKRVFGKDGNSRPVKLVPDQ